MITEELPKLDYCIELKEMWEQHNNIIKWTSPAYQVGYVRLGDVNLARISFWEENYYNIKEGSKKHSYRRDGGDLYTAKEIADDLLKKTYYYGISIKILNIATGEQIWNTYTIDFGDDTYLHKKDWTWKDDYEVDVKELIKKAGRAMMWIEVWCK